MEPSSPRSFNCVAVAGDVRGSLRSRGGARAISYAAGAVGQRVGLAARSARVGRLRSAQLLDAAGPQRGMLQLGLGQMAQHLRAHGIGVAIGERRVGVVALHLGLPVAFESG